MAPHPRLVAPTALATAGWLVAQGCAAPTPPRPASPATVEATLRAVDPSGDEAPGAAAVWPSAGRTTPLSGALRVPLGVAVTLVPRSYDATVLTLGAGSGALRGWRPADHPERSVDVWPYGGNVMRVCADPSLGELFAVRWHDDGAALPPVMPTGLPATVRRLPPGAVMRLIVGQAGAERVETVGVPRAGEDGCHWLRPGAQTGRVHIRSDPPGQDVVLGYPYGGRTPFTVELVVGEFMPDHHGGALPVTEGEQTWCWSEASGVLTVGACAGGTPP